MAMPPPEFEKPRRKFAKAKLLAPIIFLLMAGSFGVWLERLAVGEFVVDILQTAVPRMAEQ